MWESAGKLARHAVGLGTYYHYFVNCDSGDRLSA